MMFDVSLAILETFEESPGDSIDECTASMLKREGARAVLEEVIDWSPEVSDDA